MRAGGVVVGAALSSSGGSVHSRQPRQSGGTGERDRVMHVDRGTRLHLRNGLTESFVLSDSANLP